jgi:steroid delta-isomerase-like uncharacterized protein
MAQASAPVEENKRIVSGAIETVMSENDFGRYDEFYAEEFASHGSMGGDLHGREAFAAWMDTVHTAFPDFEATLEYSIAEGDRVAARIRYTGTHEETFMGIPKTGTHVSITGTTVFELRDGKITAAWPETDGIGLLRQVGALDDGDN